MGGVANVCASCMGAPPRRRDTRRSEKGMRGQRKGRPRWYSAVAAAPKRKETRVQRVD